MDDLYVSDEFIQGNLDQSRPKPRKSGPYTAQEKQKRRDEVYRLHFDFGYSSRKIADLMKINRHTIDGDISYFYSKITSENSGYDVEYVIFAKLKRLEEQRTRLRETINKTESFSEKITLERLIFDIDSKIIAIHERMASNLIRVANAFLDTMNKNEKKKKSSERYITIFDKISVSEKAQQKINQIINQDKINRSLR